MFLIFLFIFFTSFAYYRMYVLSSFINYIQISGRMAKIPKKNFRDVFNETNYYKIDFPKEATANQKGLLLGSSMLINALYFENSE